MRTLLCLISLIFSSVLSYAQSSPRIGVITSIVYPYGLTNTNDILYNETAYFQAVGGASLLIPQKKLDHVFRVLYINNRKYDSNVSNNRTGPNSLYHSDIEEFTINHGVSRQYTFLKYLKVSPELGYFFTYFRGDYEFVAYRTDDFWPEERINYDGLNLGLQYGMNIQLFKRKNLAIDANCFVRSYYMNTRFKEYYKTDWRHRVPQKGFRTYAGPFSLSLSYAIKPAN